MELKAQADQTLRLPRSDIAACESNSDVEIFAVRLFRRVVLDSIKQALLPTSLDISWRN
ncbi:hypothetical protein [Nostoc sp.]|uniref:hypothetical protein n=1 Tax=Nostoc sp. TaxID=1180 RepID=UPI002FFA5E63